VRRVAVAFLAVPICLLLAVGSVAADTSPNGTNFYSASSNCSTSGSRQVCTDTSLYVFSNEDGSVGPPCLEVFKYSISSNGRFTVISDEFGCAAGSNTVAIGADLSVAISATQIPLDSCNRRTCTSSRTVTVSASDSPTGPITTTTTRSTTKSGNCTTKSTTTDQSAELAGTLTVDGTVYDETGFIDIFTTTETTHCK
jgi:hypothetical protein